MNINPITYENEEKGESILMKRIFEKYFDNVFRLQRNLEKLNIDNDNVSKKDLRFYGVAGV